MLAHCLDRRHPIIGQEAPMIHRHMAWPNRRPIPVKRPARLTWSKGGGPAHGKPVNDMFAYSPFTAR